MTIKLICLDADDTLWHNMRHFNAAEESLFTMLRPFAEADIARDRLARCEERNLKLYGYGAKGFTLSMIETALEVGGDRLPPQLIRDILHAGRQLLAHPVELLGDIQQTLESLAQRGRLALVTKGDLLHQESKLAASGLGDLFATIEIVSDKKAATFERLFERQGVRPEEAVMAGDSLRSDVLPALEAGAWAAFVPHDLQWSHEHAEEPVGHRRYKRLGSLADLPAWIDEIGLAA
ncbi:HAD family hydrolase [Sphingomonas piscis]|uniref:HAD family hydrolase n=1 Tax=Sphingomonas piscis TaxID=2714943 RepID=A0A6G7YRJ5_9SPHN|nr:HAD family hydrolase [Sphingomonas piscis]QIK79368.1 HAD family hydrolase [Sphingomonas piscis]